MTTENNKQQLHWSSRFFVNRSLVLLLLTFSLIRLVTLTRKTIIDDYLPNNYNHNVSLVLTNQTIVEDIVINVNDKMNVITSAQQRSSNDQQQKQRNQNLSYSNSNSTDRLKKGEYTNFHNKVWPSLRHVLCGRGSPNLMLSRTLFRLARSEVFQENDPTIANKDFRNVHGKPSSTLSAFFVGDFGTSIYRDASNPSLTTVYVKIWKCGNNQIRWMEKKMWSKRKGTYVPKMGLSHALGQYLYTRNTTDGTYIYNPFINETNMTVVRRATINNIDPPCIYTVIRDPITHFLSGYNEVEVRILGEYNNGTSEYNTKNNFAPYHFAVPYSDSSALIRRRRFSAFVEDLLREDEAFSKHYQYSHFFSMSRILPVLSSYNLSLTGYIPTLENLTSTWPAFISSNCPGAPSIDKIPKMTIQGQHRSSKDRLKMYKAAKDVWEEGGKHARSLCIIHAYDYACWKDLTEGIPNLCIEVFEKHERQIIKYGSENYYSYDY